MCIADRCDMQTTDDYRIRSHGVLRREQIARVYFLETRETCSGMRGGAQNLSVRLKKSLVFSCPEGGSRNSMMGKGLGWRARRESNPRPSA